MTTIAVDPSDTEVDLVVKLLDLAREKPVAAAALDYLTTLWSVAKSSGIKWGTIAREDQGLAEAIEDVRQLIDPGTIETAQMQWAEKKEKQKEEIQRETLNRKRRRLNSKDQPLQRYHMHVDAVMQLDASYGLALTKLQNPTIYYKNNKCQLQTWWQVLVSFWAPTPAVSDAQQQEGHPSTKRSTGDPTSARPKKRVRQESIEPIAQEEATTPSEGEEAIRTQVDPISHSIGAGNISQPIDCVQNIARPDPIRYSERNTDDQPQAGRGKSSDSHQADSVHTSIDCESNTLEEDPQADFSFQGLRDLKGTDCCELTYSGSPSSIIEMLLTNTDYVVRGELGFNYFTVSRERVVDLAQTGSPLMKSIAERVMRTPCWKEDMPENSATTWCLRVTLPSHNVVSASAHARGYFRAIVLKKDAPTTLGGYDFS